MLTPSEQLGDFLNQLPTGLFVSICGSLLLLFVAFSWFVYFKPLRAKRLDKKQQTTTPDIMPAVSAVSMAMDDDLPDLGALVDVPPPDDTDAEPADTDVVASEDLQPDSEPAPDTLIQADTVPTEPVQAPTQPPMTTANAATPPPQPAPPTPGSIPAPAGKKQVHLHTGQHITADEVVMVLRDPRDGRLIVQIDGIAYRTLLNTPEVKKRFVNVMRELSTVVTEPDDADLDDAPDTLQENVPSSQPASPPTAAAPPPPPINTDGQMPGDLPKYNLDDSVVPTSRGLFGTKYEAQPIPELNIAASIEAYLQHKLRHTPEYAGRVLHIHSAPGGGVQIQVDNSFYEAVSDVTDPEIREFLSATIQEWQERQ